VSDITPALRAIIAAELLATCMAEPTAPHASRTIGGRASAVTLTRGNCMAGWRWGLTLEAAQPIALAHIDANAGRQQARVRSDQIELPIVIQIHRQDMVWHHAHRKRRASHRAEDSCPIAGEHTHTVAQGVGGDDIELAVVVDVHK
jgi:hypothetical protein